MVPKSGRGSSFSAWETIRLLVIGTWRDGRDGEGRTYLQQKLQAAAESVQLSTGIRHRLPPSPVALEDGGDSSCGEDGGRQTSERSGAPETPHLSPSAVPELSLDTLTLQVPGHLEDRPFFRHEYLKDVIPMV